MPGTSGSWSRPQRPRAEESSQILPFTRLVVDRLGPPERVLVIEMLYEVVLADGELHPDEDTLVRRVAGLIYVTDHDRGAARKRVRERLGLPD
ncbi:MAG: TerB family tellurite resistance protein [Aliidongia sp.]